MQKLRIGIVDLVAKGPTRALYARVMNANLASIMPQVLATWCEQRGHDVRLVCYTGFEDLLEELPDDIDILFVGAFSQAAQMAYAISAMFRSRGVVTCLGGPHARCNPEDAAKYFDYVLGFTDRDTLDEVLDECVPHRPLGRRLSAAAQPATLPGVRERWKFIEPTLRKAPTFQIVPMLTSLGCPYTCSFCIDSTVAHQPFDPDVLGDDLRFLLTKLRRPRVGWHDPNFGVRFDETLDAIEAAVPPGRIDFIAESSLSLLSEERLLRLKRNGFRAMLPGIESWYDLGNKSKARSRKGEEKLEQVSGHVNLIARHMDYLQTNFVLGLDCDEGPEPFELTKRFVDLCPSAFPGYSLLTAFGRAAPLNLGYQRAGRVLGFPFHFLNNNHAMNVKPLHYEWIEFYDHVIDLTRYSFSPRAVARRFLANGGAIPRLMNVVRAVSSEGKGRIRYYTEVRRRLATDSAFRDFFEGETDVLPTFFEERVRRDLGPLWEHLPEGALRHDPLAYMKEEDRAAAA
ncbi:MAG: radical SAM protein, partial [Gemmatimonadota bacterium]|nr:radical SAM protein [Gemmatimonadota bacterium]